MNRHRFVKITSIFCGRSKVLAKTGGVSDGGRFRPCKLTMKTIFILVMQKTNAFPPRA
jgi:hypothetical protein